MTTSTPHTVISGVAYPVTSVGSGRPAELGAFFGETEFTIDMAGVPYVVQGCGGPLEGRVRFHEKDHLVGKDIRVWQVSADGQGFTAEHVAAF